jgi:penicillin-binding protein 2
MSQAGRPFRGPMTPARNRPRGNLGWLKLSVLVLFAILAAQLFRMQIVDGAEYSRLAERNHITEKTTLAARGPIVDRNGVPLVQNIPVYFATVIPDFLPDPDYVDNAMEKRRAIYLQLERITGRPALEIEQRVTRAEEDGQGYIEIAVARYLTREQALKLAEAAPSMPGVALDERPGRFYPAGLEFSHILGYIGDQTAEEYEYYSEFGYALDEPVGKAGIESYYEAELRGQRGITQAEHDAQGNLVEALDSRDAVAGHGVQLAIDAELQTYIYELLQLHLGGDEENPDATVAAAVVMNAQTGKVAAIVSYPAYDNNIFSEPDKRASEYLALLEDERHPLLNQALTPSAPGSTFKLVTAAAALQNETLTPDVSRAIDSPILKIEGENGQIYPFYDWTTHGTIDLYGAIARSSNIYFYMASCGIPKEYRGLGPDDETSGRILGYYARNLGFGSVTGIDIGGEAPGIIPTPEWKREVHADDNVEDQLWYYADTCFMGIGQGDVLATPMQVNRMTAAIANGGKLFTPQVADKIIDAEGVTVRQVEAPYTTVDVDPKWLAVIRQGMLESVNGGAGAKAYRDGIEIAGKTGTAEFYDKDAVKRQHAWFTGFAPYSNPQWVVTVYFDFGVGGNKAAPVAGDIFSYMADLGYYE